MQAIVVKDTKRSKSIPRRKCWIIPKSNCVFNPLYFCLSDWHLQQVGVLFGIISVGIARMCWFENLSFDSSLMNVTLSRISKLSSRLNFQYRLIFCLPGDQEGWGIRSHGADGSEETTSAADLTPTSTSANAEADNTGQDNTDNDSGCELTFWERVVQFFLLCWIPPANLGDVPLLWGGPDLCGWIHQNFKSLPSGR